jgi:hypothetical protein
MTTEATEDKSEPSPGEPNENEDSEEDATFNSLAAAFAGISRAFLLSLGQFGLTKAALRIALTKRAFLTIGSRTTAQAIASPALHFEDGVKPKQYSNKFSVRAAGECTASKGLRYELIRSYHLHFLFVRAYRKPLSKGACWVLLCLESMIS